MFLLDTNVLSELRVIGRANPKVVAWAAAQRADDIYVSAMTVMEIEIGTRRLERKDPSGGKALRNWIEMMILPRFSGRILPVDLAVARACASFQVPKTRSDRDALIAATALVHAMTVVTRNVADFQFPGVKVLNPWTT